MRQTKIGTTARMLVVALAVAACGPQQSAQPAPAPATPFEVVVGVSGEPSTLDPHQQFQGGLDRLYTYAMFDKLLNAQDPGEGPGPGLAESWTFAPDGMSLTLKLRRGVKFHDGTPFNAEAVKFNYERELDPNNEFYKIGTYKLAPVEAANIKVPIDVIDENTVKINFKQFQAPDLNLEPMVSATHAMVSPVAVKAAREKFGEKPIGTGPYKFVSYEKGQRIVLEKNPDHWAGAPKVDKLIFVFISDPDARLNALRTGTIDINGAIDGDQLDAIASDKSFDVVSKPTRANWHVLLNQKLVPELKDKRVRAALNYAVNKVAIVKDINRDRFVASTGPLSPAFDQWFNKDLKGFPYDVAKAKQLLAEAGFPDGRGFPALVMKVPTNVIGSGKPVPMAEAIQANLAAVGIKVSLETMLKATWDKQVTTPDAKWQIAAFPLGGSRVDPDNYMAGYHSTRLPPKFHNWGYYRNEEYEKLYPQSFAEKDQSKRIKMMWRLQEIAAFEDPAAIWIAHPKFSIAYNKTKVKNLVILTDYPRFDLFQRA